MAYLIPGSEKPNRNWKRLTVQQTQKLKQGHPDLYKIYVDPTLTPEEKKRRGLEYVAALKDKDKNQQKARELARAEIARIRGELSKIDMELDELRRERVENLSGWLKGPLVLERNDCTRLHMLKQAMEEETVFLSERLETMPEDIGSWTGDFGLYQVFVVEHDWARAFQGAGDFAEGHEFKLPYDNTLFEFRISGRSVIVCISQERIDKMMIFIQVLDVWGLFMPSLDGVHPLSELVMRQIKAISVALEAEVATHEVVRAPHKLNVKRERQGKPLLVDHRVVRLSRRSRIANPTVPREEGTKKRLHFRRGHWRHYPSHKTWIKWMLVGDPDLGFVDHEYRL
jgi:hypothetical protein